MPQTKQTLSLPFLYRRCYRTIWALTVLLFCYLCSSPSLTAILPRNLCFLFYCCLLWHSSGWEESNPNRKKSNLLIYGNCTKPNNILNKIRDCRSLFAGEEMDFTLQTLSSCPIASSHTNKLSQSPWPPCCCNDHLTALINWRTSKFMSWNQWNSSRWEKEAVQWQTHHSFLLDSNALSTACGFGWGRADPRFHSTATLAPPRSQLFFGRTATWSPRSTSCKRHYMLL